MVEILRSGYKTRISVNANVVRKNQATGAREPALTIKHKGNTFKATEAQINGASRIVYSHDEPLPCGARVWIETLAEVVLDPKA